MAALRPLKYDNLAVPLYYEVEFTQNTAGTDIVTLSGHMDQTGDFLACVNHAGTERFAVSAKGGFRPRLFTTRPTTGLVKGEVILLFHNSLAKIGVCTSTAAQTIKMAQVRTKTFGRRTVTSTA